MGHREPRRGPPGAGRACSATSPLRDHDRSHVSTYDWPVTRTDLPREVRHEALDCRRLVSTLDLIDGESVIVRLASREFDDDSTAGIASIVGEFRHQVPSRYEGHEYAIGNPYPDRSPESLAGGILFIREQTFERATLTTFDGNDHFLIDIKTRCLDILIQDGNSTYP